MKRRNTLPFIILTWVFFGLSIVLWILYTKNAKSLETSRTISVQLVQSWYNAKDALTCVIDILWNDVDYMLCDKYVQKTIDDYSSYKTFVWDYSQYFPKQ